MNRWSAARVARIGAALTGSLLLVSMTACGGQGSFPDALPCDPPAPTPRPQRNSPNGVDAVYRTLVSQGITTLESTTQEFRTQWPYDRPSSNLEFRQAFVDYARTITCQAEYLRGLQPAGANLTEFDAGFDSAMTDTIDIAEFGRDSVKARNTSDFRDWIKRVEAMPSRYDDLLAGLPPRQ